MAMIFMQILRGNAGLGYSETELGSNIDTNSDSDSEAGSDANTDPTPDLNPGPEPDWQDPDTEQTPLINHSDPDLTLCDSHMTGVTGGVTLTGSSRQKVAGYVNEVALNSKAMEVVGDMQLTWKWVTGRQMEGHQARRHLILTLKNLE